MSADRDPFRASRGLMLSAFIGLLIWAGLACIGIAVIDGWTP